jgi:hypothetical protein
MKARTRYVTTLVLLAVAGSAALAGEIATRYGGLKVGGRFQNEISFKGRRLVQADNGLSEVRTFKVGGKDVVLLQETGGSACPALYYFVTVSPSGARATRAFGTCAEQISVSQKGDRILVSMPGHLGPFEPAGAREKAAKEKHVFTYRAGMVSESGKPVK